MKQINETVVPDDLYNYAKMICDKGGKVFLSKMGDDHTDAFPEQGCTNCNGGGAIMLEWFVTPASESPVSVGRDAGRNPTTSMTRGKKWYGKKMKSYNCPVCSIVSAPKQILL